MKKGLDRKLSKREAQLVDWLLQILRAGSPLHRNAAEGFLRVVSINAKKYRAMKGKAVESGKKPKGGAR